MALQRPPRASHPRANRRSTVGEQRRWAKQAKQGAGLPSRCFVDVSPLPRQGACAAWSRRLANSPLRIMSMVFYYRGTHHERTSRSSCPLAKPKATAGNQPRYWDAKAPAAGAWQAWVGETQEWVCQWERRSGSARPFGASAATLFRVRPDRNPLHVHCMSSSTPAQLQTQGACCAVVFTFLSSLILRPLGVKYRLCLRC